MSPSLPFSNQKARGIFGQAGAKVAAMRILLVNLDQGSTHEVTQALSGQGYEITTGRDFSVDEIVGLSPGVLITEATPSDLSCCGLISQIKAGPDPRTLKIVMIVHGGALERARALDLRGDDVISFPFEPVEFADCSLTELTTERSANLPDT